MTRSRVLAPAVLSLCLVVASCGDARCADPTPTTTTVTTAPQVSRIRHRAADHEPVGDTVKLSLTAFYTNGTSRGWGRGGVDSQHAVSRASSEWRSDGIGTRGHVCLGEIRPLWFRIDQVRSPPGTFAIVGGTREPGMSGEPGVTVTHPASGPTTVSDAEGSLTMGGLTDRTVVLQKAGFEDATYTVVPEDFQWLAVQRQILVQAGDTVSVRIAPHDMDYAPLASGERCSPCKLIRLTNTPGTRVRVTLKWTPVSIGLKLWNDDGTLLSVAGCSSADLRDKTGVDAVGQSPKGATLT